MHSARKRAKLVPYDATQPSQTLELNGTIERTGSNLSLEFELKGDTGEILFPAPSPNSNRLDKLWEHTCFEAFFTWDKNEFYWELNLSPSGDWNLYRFENYRQGQTSEEKINPRISKFTKSALGVYSAQVSLDLGPILPQDASTVLAVGLTAVIERQDQSKSYWAIEHRGSKPDFHIRQSFSLKI